MTSRVIGNPTLFGGVDSVFESREVSQSNEHVNREHNSVGRVADF